MNLPKLSPNKEHSIFNLNKFRDEVQARLSLARDSVDISGKPRPYMGEVLRSQDRKSSTTNRSHASKNLALDSEEENRIRESHDFMQRVEKELDTPQKRRINASVPSANRSQSRQCEMLKVY